MVARMLAEHKVRVRIPHSAFTRGGGQIGKVAWLRSRSFGSSSLPPRISNFPDTQFLKLITMTTDEIKKQLFTINIRLNNLAEEIGVKSRNMDKLFLEKIKLQSELLEMEEQE